MGGRGGGGGGSPNGEEADHDVRTLCQRGAMLLDALEELRGGLGGGGGSTIGCSVAQSSFTLHQFCGPRDMLRTIQMEYVVSILHLASISTVQCHDTIGRCVNWSAP